MASPVSESVDINAPADVVYALVADLPSMGQWSPECIAVEWRGGASAPAVGAKFKGQNRIGRRKWSSDGVIVTAEPGRKFAFETSAMRIPVAHWAYEFTERDGGCTVTESWSDRRPAWFVPITRLATGVTDRSVRNEETMRTTLERIKAAAEAAPR
jgi:hypothetical protein